MLITGQRNLNALGARITAYTTVTSARCLWITMTYAGGTKMNPPLTLDEKKCIRIMMGFIIAIVLLMVRV